MTQGSDNPFDPPALVGEDLSFEATRSTPEVYCDWNKGHIRMAGESYPENPYEMFDSIISWVEHYLQHANRPLVVELELNYLNTSSVRAMIEILDLLQDAHDHGKSAAVRWIYDPRNPRSSEMAEEFMEDYSFAFLIGMTAS
ncbi:MULTISPECIES: biofilm regulation phosphoprotein SiaC [Aphanothece]|uniref:biofilm regulation phosphoprotein SiaC n=1 Tax=Aphanothece TaxID=1121 RepID=UPI0039852F98